MCVGGGGAIASSPSPPSFQCYLQLSVCNIEKLGGSGDEARNGIKRMATFYQE